MTTCGALQMPGILDPVGHDSTALQKDHGNLAKAAVAAHHVNKELAPVRTHAMEPRIWQAEKDRSSAGTRLALLDTSEKECRKATLQDMRSPVLCKYCSVTHSEKKWFGVPSPAPRQGVALRAKHVATQHGIVDMVEPQRRRNPAAATSRSADELCQEA